jgi:TRAP-type C4-dicarboxylate transport system substrate-binding protein
MVTIAISNKAWNAMSPAQKQKMTAAVQAASSYNNENCIKEESQSGEFFRRHVCVTTPMDAFRKSVQATYMNYAKVPPKGL